MTNETCSVSMVPKNYWESNKIYIGQYMFDWLAERGRLPKNAVRVTIHGVNRRRVPATVNRELEHEE